MTIQTKKYVFYKLKDRQVSISEAPWLLDNTNLVQNRNTPAFSDIKNPNIRSGVFPVKSSIGKNPKIAYFSYYSVKDKIEIIASKEMTNAHLLFQLMFKKLDKFTIKDNLTDTEIKVAIDFDSTEMEYYVKN